MDRRGPIPRGVSAGIPQPLAISLPSPAHSWLLSPSSTTTTTSLPPHFYAVWPPPNTPSFLRALILPGPRRGSPGPPPSPLSNPCPPVTHPHFLPHLVLENPTDPGVPFCKQVLCPLKLGMGMHADTGRPWPREAGTRKGARLTRDSVLPATLPGSLQLAFCPSSCH